MRFARRALLIGGLMAPVCAMAEQFAGKYAPVAEPVADGIWMVRGADEPIGFANGGAIANSAIMATDAGAVLFDPGVSREHGLALAALTKRLTGKAVGRVYISHLHPDHAMGAAAFDPALIHALPATRSELEHDGDGFSDAMYRLLADWMKGTALVLPQGDVSDGRVEFGGRSFRMLALKGHSGGDLALIDEATGTLVAGDLVFHQRAPSTPHANLPDWRASLETLAAVPHTVVIPGHGPLDRSGAAIAQTRDWLDWMEATLRDAVSRGLDMTEAGELPIPSRFSGLKAARYELQRSVSHFYPRLEAELLPQL